MKTRRTGFGILLLVLALAEILIGALLLIDPAGFTGGIVVCAGLLAMLYGLWLIVRYALMPPVEAAQRQLLFRGMCAFLAGLVMVLYVQWILTVFPALIILYGICILLVGLRRVQWCADAIRLRFGNWYWYLISAALALAVAVVTLLNPFATTLAMWIFVGIALIVEGLLDFLSLLFTNDRRERGDC